MRRLMLGIAVAVTSLLPVMGMADDQQIADFIKGRLQSEQQAGNLRGFNVDMRVERGTVWFKGHVANSSQEMMILQTAQGAGHLGVVKVVDDINVQVMQAGGYSQTPFQQATYTQPQPQPLPPRSYQPQPQPQEVFQDYGAAGGIISGEPLPFASSGGGVPAMQASYGAGATAEAPNLPGYAWPTTAAHPNYGALAYPQQYSPSAWPYIGPFYPYPQVPLGWRKVSLEWVDGWWMLDFHDK